MVPTGQADRRAEVNKARAAPTNPTSSSRLVWSFSGGFALVFAPFFFLIWGLGSDSISPPCLLPLFLSPPPGTRLGANQRDP